MADTGVTVPRRLSPESMVDFAGQVARLVADDGVGAVVVRGGTGVFCEGVDFEAFAAAGGGSGGGPASKTIRDAVEAFAGCLTSLRFSTKPTVALVDGAARGGGLGIAAACDVLIATEESEFALPEVLFGLLPAVVVPFLLDRLSAQTVRLWALSGESQPARAALDTGLVDAIVPGTGLDAEGRRWVRRLSRGDAGAAFRLRRFVSEAAADRDAALDRGVTLTAEALCDPAVRTRIARFANSGSLPRGDG